MARLSAMRIIVGIVCLLLGLGMLSCRVEGIANPRGTGNVPAGGWVRTVDGWERRDTWNMETAHPPRLHPLVVAAGQGLFSLLGLVALGRRADDAIDDM